MIGAPGLARMGREPSMDRCAGILARRCLKSWRLVRLTSRCRAPVKEIIMWKAVVVGIGALAVASTTILMAQDRGPGGQRRMPWMARFRARTAPAGRAARAAVRACASA